MVPLYDGLILNLFTSNLFFDIVLLIIFLLLFVNLFFLTVAETAFTSVNIIRLRNYMEEKRRCAKKAVFLAEKFDATLTTILIAKTFTIIIITALSVFFFISVISFRFFVFAIAVVATVFSTLLFGEIIPRQCAKEHAERSALRTALLMYIIFKILFPFTFVFMKLKKIINKKTEKHQVKPKVTEEELESIIEVMETEGIIGEDDADLLQSAIGLNETAVYDIMTPRVDVIAVSIDDSVEDIKKVFFEYQFSRIPVYKDDKDNIVGILSERDFFTALLQNKKTGISPLLSSPYYVSEATKVNELIKEMQKQKKHFAVVSDEYGGTSGIVTMEDALEELVGEIYDEYDEEEYNELAQISPGKYLVPPNMDMDELFEQLNLGEGPESKYTSVSGFVYSLCEGLPTEGQVVSYEAVVGKQAENGRRFIKYDLEFTIKKVENRRITAIELDIKEMTE